MGIVANGDRGEVGELASGQRGIVPVTFVAMIEKYCREESVGDIVGFWNHSDN